MATIELKSIKGMTIEEQNAEYDRRMAAFEAAYGGKRPGAAYYMTAQEVERLEADFGLFCPICDHGNGCEHGVPVARV